MVGGANGANRLSGNAITEALVFGRRAGRSAARVRQTIAAPEFGPQDTRRPRSICCAPIEAAGASANTAAMIAPAAGHHGRRCRTVAHRRQAAPRDRPMIAALADELGERPPGRPGAFDLQRLEWFDLRNMLLVARAVAAIGVQSRPKAAARISARIFRTCCRNGSGISACAGATAHCKFPARRRRGAGVT